MKKEVKIYWQKFWNLFWKDNTWKGWVFSLIVIFVVIKLILFPTLNLVTGTTLPLAIVESCSMYHKGDLFSNYDEWWERHEEKYSEFEITKEQFRSYIFKKGFNKGDILFVVGANPDKLKIGDVIIFNGNQANPIIHRIVEINEINGERVFSTIGDNNNGQLAVEKSIKESQLVGKSVFKLAPFIGWAKLIFYEPYQPPTNKGFCDEN